MRARPRASVATGERSRISQTVSTVSIVWAAMMRKSPPPAIPWMSLSVSFMSVWKTRKFLPLIPARDLLQFPYMMKQIGAFVAVVLMLGCPHKPTGNEIKHDTEAVGRKIDDAAKKARQSEAG